MLDNKIILLTGGADGIGWECAKVYAAQGASLCIADQDPQIAVKISMLPGEHIYFIGDISREETAQGAIAATIQRYGRLNAIHNNAGITHPSKPLHDTSDSEWEQLMAVNLKSILYTTRHGIEHLKKTAGAILNTSSMVGSIGQDNHAAYVATKGAVNALTKAMALDYAAWSIRINAVSPAAVNTPALEKWGREQPNSEAIQQYLDHLHPLGPLPSANVIADAAAFLLSDAARFITGCILLVSGGAELGYRTLLTS